ncbi:ATP-dependent DNA helicase, UvrD/REP family [Clostridium perfringens]|nr:ATP-dependent DNA helicase, UvrD/REP family [Clostridium perfringens]
MKSKTIFLKKLGEKVSKVLDKVDFQYEYKIARLKKVWKILRKEEKNL